MEFEEKRLCNVVVVVVVGGGGGGGGGGGSVGVANGLYLLQ